MSRAERLSAIFASIRVGVVAVDARAVIEFQNPEASRILGRSRQTLVGRNFAEALGREHPAVELIWKALREGREMSWHACPLPSQLGSELISVDLSASPISDGGGGAVLLLRDGTIEAELQARAAQHREDEGFGHLAGGIAHELRNPLGGIRGAAELLLGKLSEPKLARYPTLIRDEVDRMRRLLDDFAELTRGGDFKPRPSNLYVVLDNILELQASRDAFDAIAVRREYDPSIPEFDFDADRMTQVFLNLVRNAVQAMEGRGTLRILTRVETNYHVSPQFSRPVRMVRIDITDDGPGIPESDQPHIFTPFFTQRTKGTGLGLSIAQHWTVRHGGRIQVQSRPGEGTRMRVLLPLVRNSE